MKIRSQRLNRTAGFLATQWVRGWMSTLDYQGWFHDPTVDPADPRCRGQKLYLFWHEYILLPLAIRGHCNLSMLLSRHQDAEILSHVARYMGFDTVRGSTARGGAAALRELLRKSQQMHLTMVPDGPRGPRRQMAPGPIYLASRLGLPLVLLGLGFDRPWRAGSWDRFAVPRPWSRARGVVSEAIYLPSDLDRDGLEHYRRQIEKLLNQLTEQAEHWAASGQPLQGAVSARQQPASLWGRRIDAAERAAGRDAFRVAPGTHGTTDSAVPRPTEHTTPCVAPRSREAA